MVRDYAVDFLRHPAIETPETRLDMNHRDMHFGGSQRTGESRICIAIHQNAVWLLGKQYVLNRHQHRTGLSPMRPRADAQVYIGRRNFQAIEKDAGHCVVIMLTGMHQNFLVALAQLPAQRGSLDELRPRPHKTRYLHSLARLALCFFWQPLFFDQT